MHNLHVDDMWKWTKNETVPHVTLTFKCIKKNCFNLTSLTRITMLPRSKHAHRNVDSFCYSMIEGLYTERSPRLGTHFTSTSSVVSWLLLFPRIMAFMLAMPWPQSMVLEVLLKQISFYSLSAEHTTFKHMLFSSSGWKHIECMGSQ